jgi:hypothetical protein
LASEEAALNRRGNGGEPGRRPEMSQCSKVPECARICPNVPLKGKYTKRTHRDEANITKALRTSSMSRFGRSSQWADGACAGSIQGRRDRESFGILLCMNTIESLEPRTFLSATRILFIRGGSGTGGFIDGGTLAQRDEELADVNNTSTNSGNHGWGELANLLRGEGFSIEQRVEGPKSNNTPVDLAALDLSQYAVIVFGSNNADYSTPSVNALESYVRSGGGALFISDGNFGSFYGDAPSSDQEFLNRFGLVMNQDKGRYTLTRSGGDFRNGAHPILSGVNSFDGEGVSPGVRAKLVSSVTPQVLVGARDQTRDNDSSSAGTTRDVTTNDGALIVAAAGHGRVAISFDRNTFFNANGQGSNLHKFDNTTYARNLFTWLAGRTGTSRPEVRAADFRYDDLSTSQSLRIAFSKDVSASLAKTDLHVTNLTTGQTFSTVGLSRDAGNWAGQFRFNGALPDGNYRATIAAGAVTDSAGHTMAANWSYDFFMYRGDANRDRKVDTKDFAMLENNFGKVQQIFPRGNFDYDPAGAVNTLDFNVLAARFGQSFAPPASSAPAATRLTLAELRIAPGSSTGTSMLLADDGDDDSL